MSRTCEQFVEESVTLTQVWSTCFIMFFGPISYKISLIFIRLSPSHDLVKMLFDLIRIFLRLSSEFDEVVVKTNLC